MTMRKLLIVFAIFLSMLVTGCYVLGGGGWFPGLNGGKAHFGFEAACYEEDDWYMFHEGHFQYMDKSAGVKFHGTLFATLGLGGFESCEEAAMAFFTEEELTTAQIEGDCITRPGKNVGTFLVYLEDNGTPGMKGDYIEVSTTGCGADGGDYFHSGMLSGGNIWIGE